MMLFKKNMIPISEVTPGLLAKFNKKYPNEVFEILVDNKKAYFRVPASKELKRTFKKIINGNPVELGFKLFIDSFLAGDIELITDDNFIKDALDKHWLFISDKIKKVAPEYAHLI